MWYNDDAIHLMFIIPWKYAFRFHWNTLYELIIVYSHASRMIKANEIKHWKVACKERWFLVY